MGGRALERTIEFGESRETGTTRFAGSQMRIGARRIGGCERAVVMSRELFVGQVRAHEDSPLPSDMRRLSSARARERRDMTVPTGTPSAVAMAS